MNLTSTLHSLPLFAADLESFFRGVGSEFSGNRAKLGWNDAGIMLTVVTVIVGLVFLLSRYLAKNEGVRLNSPSALLKELCQLHGLKFNERRALQKLAAVHRLEHPGRLFLEPERFAHAAEHPQLAAQAGVLADLRKRLFAGLEAP